jgi:polyhydroxyalkanoate synthesis repressor PhaR
MRKPWFDEADRANRCIVALQHLCLSRDGRRMSNPTREQTGGGKPVVVKKYANRRLYNTASSSYVTLDDLATMIKQGGDFVVYDAKTGEDLTRSVLTQIIVEQEQKGQNLLPISFLRQLISFYGDSMQFLVPGYLEQAMVQFARNQDQMRNSLRATFGIFPFGQFEEMGKQNMALFERTLRMLSPHGQEGTTGAAASDPPASAEKTETSAPQDPHLRRLEDQIEVLRKQLEALGRDRKEG